MTKISLVINTKNEEKFIEECILSAKDIVDEIIVADMHSTDKTVEIAGNLGARIYYVEDVGFVEPARNFAISQATNQWILLLDADERITPRLAHLLTTIAQENKYEAVRMPRKNIQLNKWIKHAGWWPDYQLRFFQKDKVKFGTEIHSSPVFSKNYFSVPEEEDLAILHYNFRSVDQLIDKIFNYTKYEEKLTISKVKEAQDFINYFEGEFNKRYLLNSGYKDGLHGYILSKFMEFYRFLEVARFWEKHNYENITDVEKLQEIKIASSEALLGEIEKNKTEIEKLKLWAINLEKDYDKSKLDYANLENDYGNIIEERNRLKLEREREKEKINNIFNDDTLIKLYYSKDWKHVLKFYSFKKKYLSNDSPISKKVNSFVDIFKTKKKQRVQKKGLDHTMDGKLQKNVDYSKTLVIPLAENPVVSIIIPVYNGWKMNYRCVKSIIENTSGLSYEIIFADDCSTDETKNCTDKITNLVHLYNTVNLGFLKNCNHAVKSARGEFILLLNSDTEVLPNWLSPLVALIRSDEKIGMVGSKLIYPDGRLQEAGGIIWNDASGWNYGKFQDANAPEYNYIKEVDYISGASIMLRKSLWQQLGGFDERFVPAYFEDSDLAFAIREKGYKIMYQPLSEVVHYESVSHGKEEEQPVEGKISIKSVRLLNQKKFYEKWKEVLLREHFPNAENAFHARDRSAGKKTILIIDHYVPEYDKDAGSKSVFQYIELFLSLGLQVKFIGDNFFQSEPYTTILQQMGVEVLYGEWYKNNWKNWIQTNHEFIDFVFLNRPHTSLKYITFLKQNTKAKILYYGHDLHFLRELRRYEIDKDPEALLSSDQWKSKEQFIYENADYILSPNQDETKAIMQINPSYKAITIPLYFYKIPSYPVENFTDRKNILFIGGFGHPPNVDGIIWFCKNVWPIVTAKIEGIKFTIAGSKPTPEIKNLKSENIDVLGYVTEHELKNLYSKTRVVVIPMRYGAGMKGKTLEAMHNGIPIVSTTIGLEGMPEGVDFIKPFDNAESFANEIISIYQDTARLVEMSSKETGYINRHFTWKSAREQFNNLLT